MAPASFRKLGALVNPKKTTSAATPSNSKEHSQSQATQEATCAHQQTPSATPCPECKAENKARVKYRWKLMLGLVWPFALQALDSTIIASALPWIASDFKNASQLNWIVSAFNLTAAAFIPFWSQMVDVFGRNGCLNGAIISMLIGSTLCTAAPTTAFPMLLLGRGFQGLAAAGINVITRTILADKVTLQENAKNWALFSFVGGVSYAVGPVIGGYLTNANWRWCFAINLPVAVVALIVTFFVLRPVLLGPQPIPELDETVETGRRTKLVARLKTIDFGGQALFIFGFGLIILGLTWGGANYPWASAAVIVSLVLGAILSGAFACWEYLLAPGNSLAVKMPWQRPMIPWALLSNRDMGLLFFCECTTGIGMYAVLYFCNIYFTAVKGYDSDHAGVQLLYFLPGLASGTIICNFLLNRTFRMTWPAVFLGTLTESIGIGILGYAVYAEQSHTVYGMMALVGIGCGMRFMASPLHGIGLFNNLRAAVIGLMAVAVPFGGTIGLTIMSSVFNNVSGLSSDDSFSNTKNLPKAEREKAIHDAKMGIVWAFVAITPLLVFAFCCSLCLGNVKFGAGPPDEDGPTNLITRDIYLLMLLRRSKSIDEEERSLGAESSAVEHAPKGAEGDGDREKVDINATEESSGI